MITETAASIGLGLGTIRKIFDMWRGAKSESLIDYTRVGRVEPIVLIDADAMYYENIGEVQQSLLSIFAGYYLQAVAFSGTVGKIDVMRQLDKLNPTRNAVDSAAHVADGWLLAQESYQHALPMYNQKPSMALEALTEDEKEQMARDKHQWGKESNTIEFGNYELKRKQSESDAAYKERQAALNEEAHKAKIEEIERNFKLNEQKFGHEQAMAKAKLELEREGLELNRQKQRDVHTASEINIGRDSLNTLKELTNLSVGKMLSVEITDGLHKASIPIAIRLMASSLPTASLIHILSHGNKDNSFKERYHAWRSGRIAFIRDLCMCQDLIDAHRKNLMTDKDSMYSNLLKRQRGNQLSTLVSGNPSISTASNLVVMTSDTVAQLELHLNGKFSDFHTRERIFKDTYLMIVAVIDKQWDRVTFYHRGMNLPTQVGVRDLKASNKGNGPDVSDILKAYQFGNAPSL